MLFYSSFHIDDSGNLGLKLQSNVLKPETLIQTLVRLPLRAKFKNSLKFENSSIRQNSLKRVKIRIFEPRNSASNLNSQSLK